MENVFAKIESPGVYINIEKMKIDLGKITPTDFQHHLVQLIEPKLINELRAQMPSNQNPVSPKEEKGHPDFYTNNINDNSSLQFNSDRQQSLKALLYFLEHGNYPWWYKENIRQTPAQLLDKLTKEETESLIFKLRSLRGDEQAKTFTSRLLIHLPQANYNSLISQTVALFNEPSLSNNVQQLINNKDELKQLYTISESDFYSHLFHFLISENIEGGSNAVEKFINGLNPGQKHNIGEPTSEHEKKLIKRKQPGSPMPREGIYVANAGLILLHPFLQAFFAEAGLLNEENQFISIAAQQKATILLYYLQSGSEEYKEWEMALNKILCGMAFDDLVPDGILITGKEKEESRALLQAVVNYWQALKNTSIESVQNTFFLREGKITWKEDHWLIQIERTSLDILIETLPWSFTTIKFPWLEHLIFTEW